MLFDESFKIILENGVDKDQRILFQVCKAGQFGNQGLFGGYASRLLEPLRKILALLLSLVKLLDGIFVD